MSYNRFRKAPYEWDGNILKVIRGLSGLSTSEMAWKLLLTEESYLNMEKGGEAPDFEELLRIADYTGGSLDYLTGRRKEDIASVKEEFRLSRSTLFEDYLKNGRRGPDFEHREAPWPYNLVEEILRCPVNEPMTDDQSDALFYILGNLDERERAILTDYYRSEKTTRILGNDYKLSGARIRQIINEALIKCRRMENRALLVHGLQGYELFCKERDLNNRKSMLETQIKKIEAKQLEYDQKIESLRHAEHVLSEIYGIKIEPFAPKLYDPDKDIDDLELSLRSQRCLKRAGLRTLGDLAQLSIEDLYKVRNLGKTCLGEVVNKLIELGVESPITLNLNQSRKNDS